jgi:trehalose/maltose hydrolase-like predicted phosphorylase
LDGTVTNQGVKRYRELSSRHLDPLAEGGTGNTSYLSVMTNQSEIQIGLASALNVFLGRKKISPDFKVSTVQGKVTTMFDIEARSDRPVRVEKIVSLHSSNIPGIVDPLQMSQNQIYQDHSFKKVFTASAAAWEKIWKKIDVEISGDRLAQMMIRLHLYHTLVSVSPHTAELDAGIPARGLHGEAYRGHIFWDELFIMPFYDLHFPEVSRSALRYRYNRLPAAQQAAAEVGHAGAMFPWQSGSDGSEETQLIHLNPISGKWGPDYSHRQRHVSLAIAYNLWNYYWITDDIDFLKRIGAELFLNICLFWGDLAVRNPTTNQFDIKGVMGPDEFHEKYPDSSEPGLINNAYTNLLVVWVLNRVFDILEELPDPEKTKLLEGLNITPENLTTWKEITQKMTIPLSEEGILEQFQGYFDLKELDWEQYKKTYQDVHRMDRILKSEGLSPNAYKVAKQADALMAFYLLPEKTIITQLAQLGYSPPEDLLSRNLHYYLQRTSHGSTLSRLVHAHLAHLAGNCQLSWKLYQEALRSDYLDIQGGTTQEGIHLGVMTGTVLFALRAYAGLDWSGESLSLDPDLSIRWKKLTFNLSFRGNRYFIEIYPQQVKVKVEEGQERVPILIQGRKVSLKPGRWKAIDV